MTKVRRTSGAAVLPLVAAAVGIGVGATPADAAICSPLSSASITSPSGTATAGSTVHASARVSGMLLSAHMQITGPGLDQQQVGPSAISGVIEGDVRVPKPGVFTLKVVGNGTGCVYDSDSFSVKERPSASTPSPHVAAGASGAPGATRASRHPKGIRDGGNKVPRVPRNGGSPFRLPSEAPDETGPSVRLPSADPQVAAPPVRQPQPRANNAAETVPPIKWGQSVAIALVLLLLSAHMGMWSRRQRLAAAGGRRGRGARRANASTQVTAQLPLAGDRRAVPGDRDRPTKPDDGHTPLTSGAAYTGTQQQRGYGQVDHLFPSDRSGTAHTANQDGWSDRESQVPGRSGVVGSTGETSAVAWESWVDTRRQMSASDPRGWVDAADRDGRVGPNDRGAHVRPGGEMADRLGSYPFDRRVQPGRLDGDRVRDDQADAIGRAPTPRVSGDSGWGSETGPAGSPDRGETGRAARSGRGGYRGRRRRS